MVKFILLVLLAIPNFGYTCDYPVKTEVGSCKGMLLSDKQFLEDSNSKRELRLKDLKIATLEGTQELMEMRHSVYKKELKKTRNSLSDLQIKSNFGYIISFTVGAVITGFIAREVLK